MQKKKKKINFNYKKQKNLANLFKLNKTKFFIISLYNYCFKGVGPYLRIYYII